MARHFLYSILRHEGQISMQIINDASKLGNDQVYEFLIVLLAHMDGLLNTLESKVFDYREFILMTCDSLKNPFPEEPNRVGE